jgi:spore maturation protein CgeB
LSKKFQERHTTRTFEIPACGTALLTERNPETESFFSEEEVIFYHSVEEMVNKIKYYKKNPALLQKLTENGRQRVINDGRDYKSILQKLLTSMEIDQ